MKTFYIIIAIIIGCGVLAIAYCWAMVFYHDYRLRKLQRKLPRMRV